MCFGLNCILQHKGFSNPISFADFATQFSSHRYGRCLLAVIALYHLHTGSHVAGYVVDADVITQTLYSIEMPQTVKAEFGSVCVCCDACHL